VHTTVYERGALTGKSSLHTSTLSAQDDKVQGEKNFESYRHTLTTTEVQDTVTSRAKLHKITANTTEKKTQAKKDHAKKALAGPRHKD
jgi:hypothetical protein